MTPYTFCSEEHRHLTHLVLKSALKTLRDPARWTKGEYARNAEGCGMGDVHSSAAVCFCSKGAILRAPAANARYAIGLGCVVAANGAYLVLETILGGQSIVLWNDAPERTHAEVVAVFEKAVEITSKENAKVREP